MSTPEAAAEGEIVAIQTHATDVTGRFVVSAGRNHFVSDSRPAAGGPGEAVQAGQLLLASLTSCGLGLIQGRAAELGLPLLSADVTAAFQRDLQDKTRYQWIRLVFTLGGVDAGTAATLLAHFTDTCPIFNTLRRGGTMLAEVHTV
ncbi:OsmC family protein [Polaromonas sp. SM01]|uniref:OsmC family protein n=1 Tax=Polaromonas sp. SM01 TaxID=3085630 RepID=UPI002981B27C|nr:OsmC family protein [Polaromonas sp. SM01]MDW5443666.1 OsmC family protein [Polaromonas sp. SM01]